MLFEVSDGEMTDIFWDGVVPFSQMFFGQPENERLVVNEDNGTDFLAIKPIKYLLGFSAPINKDLHQFKGTINPLPPVQIESF